MTGRRLRSKRQQPTAAETEPQPEPERAKRRKATSTRSRQAGAPETESEHEAGWEEQSVEDVEGEGDESHASAEDDAQIEQQRYPNVPRIATSKKNAPKPRRPTSMASVTVQRLEEMDGSYVEHGARHESASQEEPDPATRRKVLVLSLPDLVRAAQDLIGYHDMQNLQTSIFDLILQTKRRVFQANMEVFCPPGLPDDVPVFIDAKMFEDVDVSEVQEKLTELGASSAAQAIGYANLAIALEIIYWFETKNHDLWLGRIALLDSFLHELLAPFGDDAANSEVALSLRTLHAIRVLPERPKDKYQVLGAFASVFCQGTADPKNLYKLLNNGPYKEFSHSEDQNFEELCSGHAVGTVLEIFTYNKLSENLANLRSKTYGINEVLEQLGQWLLEVYHGVKKEDPKRQSGQQAEEPDSQVNAPPDVPDSYPEDLAAIDDDDDSNVESQPIVRAAGPTPVSLFSGQAAEFHALQPKSPRTSLPSSRQERPMRSVSEVPEMEREIENADILGAQPSNVNNPSPTRSAVVVPTRAAPQPSGQSERNAEEEEEEDEDEDNPFQEDTRPIDKKRQAAVSNLMKENRRAVPASAQAPAPSSAPMSSMLPPQQRRYPSPGPEPASPASSAAAAAPFAPAPSSSYINALREERRLVSQQVRHQAGPSMPKQRHAWSDLDSETLVELIRHRQAAWSIMEKNDNDKFQHPRNQQAYRDRARNMKVDMLLTDAVLPPCFDLVTLGKKEVDKVKSYRKNPNRREHDVDEDGRAINTELQG